jgi:hypothetical protein
MLASSHSPCPHRLLTRDAVMRPRNNAAPSYTLALAYYVLIGHLDLDKRRPCAPRLYVETALALYQSGQPSDVLSAPVLTYRSLVHYGASVSHLIVNGLPRIFRRSGRISRFLGRALTWVGESR